MLERLRCARWLLARRLLAAFCTVVLLLLCALSGAQSSQNHLLATIWPLGYISIRTDAKGTLAKWLVWNAVPTRRTNSNGTEYQLVLFGQSTAAGKAGNKFAGNHYVVYPSGAKRQFTKYSSLPGHYDGATSWFADMPDVDAQYWHDARVSRQVCLRLEIWDDWNLLNTFESCHDPTVLPPRERPHTLVYCPNKPPWGKAYTRLLPNILYHLRHGVDQFVVFVAVKKREDTLRLLRPFGDRVTVILIGSDAQPEDINIGGSHIGENWRSDTLNWFIAECLNRFRGRAQVVKVSHDLDEFDYAPSWRDLDALGLNLSATSLASHLRPFLDAKVNRPAVAYAYSMWYYWASPFSPSGVDHRARTRLTRYAPAFGKSFVFPERVAVAFTHLPTNCFGEKCVEWRPNATLLWRPPIGGENGYAKVSTFGEYAHFYVELAKFKLRYPPKQLTVIRDNFFRYEFEEIDRCILRSPVALASHCCNVFL